MDAIYRSSRAEVSSIDDKIKEYIKGIIPLLLPAKTDWKEEYQLEKILFNAAALNVYNRSMDKLQSEFVRVAQKSGHNIQIYTHQFNAEVETLKVWSALERTRPNLSLYNIALRKPTNSRYMASSIWEEQHKYEGQENKRRLVREYARRNWRKISTEQYFKKETFLPETDAAFALRDFFNNSGNLNLINFESEEYTNLVETIEVLREELVEKTYNLNVLNQTGMLPSSHSFSANQMAHKDYLYTKGCQDLRRFTGMCVATAHANSMAINLQKKEDRKLDKKEFLKLSKVVIDIFDKEFSHLPTNEAEHEQIMDDLYKRVSNYLAGMPGTRLNHPYEYKSLMKDLYKKYMKQLERGTLPIRLSYMPEDKALYEEILKRERDIQAHEKRFGNQTENIPAALMGTMVLSAAVVAGVVSALDGNFALPLTEVTAGLSGYILHKVNTNRRLNMDVEERFAIKHLSIRNARNMYDIVETANPISTMSSSKTAERNNQISRRLECAELSSEEMAIFTDDGNNQSVQTTKPRIRHRRMDRYKNETEH